MSKINGVEQPEFVFAAALKINEEVINLASGFGGKTYGNYVRTVLVPRLKDPLCVCEYDHVSIEFESQRSLNEFATALHFKYKDVVGYGEDQYGLYVQGMLICKIELWINEPNEYYFDVNCLVYYYDDEDKPLFYDQLSKTIMLLHEPPLPLLQQILDKVVNLSPTAIAQIENQDCRLVKSINEQFIAKGWTVKFLSHEVKNAITMKELTELVTPKKNVVEEYMLLQEQIKVLQNQTHDLIVKRDALLLKCLEKI